MIDCKFYKPIKIYHFETNEFIGYEYSFSFIYEDNSYGNFFVSLEECSAWFLICFWSDFVFEIVE